MDGQPALVFLMYFPNSNYSVIPQSTIIIDMATFEIDDDVTFLQSDLTKLIKKK